MQVRKSPNLPRLESTGRCGAQLAILLHATQESHSALEQFLTEVETQHAVVSGSVI